jgi:uncharacterized protein (TIGR03086 family)
VDLKLLEEVTEQFAAYLSEVTDGDLATPTPCHLWTIGDLFLHMLERNASLARALNPDAPATALMPAAPPGWCIPHEVIYRNSVQRVGQALALSNDRVRRIGESADAASPEELFECHLANTLIHTWDLVEAIQLDLDPPNSHAVDIALRYLRTLPREARGAGGTFAEPLNRPAATSMDEMLLLSGRRPGRRSATVVAEQ